MSIILTIAFFYVFGLMASTIGATLFDDTFPIETGVLYLTILGAIEFGIVHFIA